MECSLRRKISVGYGLFLHRNSLPSCIFNTSRKGVNEIMMDMTPVLVPMRKMGLVIYLILYSFPLFAQLSGSNLPLVIITTDNGGDIPDNPRVPATMKIISGAAGERNYPNEQDAAKINYNGKIQIEIRGSSSQSLSKKQYGLTTVLADKITNNNVPLLGMPAENDWVLNGLAFDPSLMRDYLSYTLSRRIGNYAPRQVYCEVVVNGSYRGLYLLQEKIKVDDERVDIARLDPTDNLKPDVTGGYIIKADKITSEDPSSWTMPTYLGSKTDFVHEYPKPSSITPEQKNYIRSLFFDFSNKANNPSITNGYPTIIDIPSFVDFMLINELSANVDAYQFSTFFHKDRNGKLRAGPLWDHNLTFGNDLFMWGFDRSKTNLWQFDNGDNIGPTFWKDLYNNSTFRCYLAKRWNQLTKPGQPLNINSIYSLIDETALTISEAVAREEQSWATVGNHADRVNAIKTFLSARIPWLTNSLGDFSSCANVNTPPLVINRIHYHPMASVAYPDESDLEFIEIVNTSSSTVALTGIYFSGVGFNYQFTSGTALPGNSVIQLANDNVAFESTYGYKPFGKFTRNLSNKSQKITLADAFGNVIDEVSYTDASPWPVADGNGMHLKLKDLSLDNSLPQNWIAVDESISSSVVVVGTENNIVASFQVYPNPTENNLTISSSEQVIECIQLQDIHGRLVQTFEVGSKEATVNLSSFTPGMYLLFIQTKDQLISKKVIRK